MSMRIRSHGYENKYDRAPNNEEQHLHESSGFGLNNASMEFLDQQAAAHQVNKSSSWERLENRQDNRGLILLSD